jgi:hypothetical protein
MKGKLLLLLSRLELAQNIPLASTLAWLAKSQNIRFDTYYDSYHQGVHFPGGDARRLDLGQLTGGTVSGDRHFEDFYSTVLSSDVSVAIYKESIFRSCLRNLGVPVVASAERISDFYRQIFGFLGIPLPQDIVMIGSHFPETISGLEAYLYPEILFRRALGFSDQITFKEMNEICPDSARIFCVGIDDRLAEGLRQRGYQVEIVDRVHGDDDYLRLTTRVAQRWAGQAKGWMIGDPTLVAHWLPTASDEDLVAIYSVPQERIIHALGDVIAAKGKVVYGRQDQDGDFFELSKLDQCFQVIDPCRPPFQSAKHIDYIWHSNLDEDGFFRPEFSDEELTQFAREGRILISLMFWSGMIREVANFHNLMDLFGITRLRCGLVLTAQSFEYSMRSPLELLTIPVERGGVFPLVEPILGSCGLGVGIESLIHEERLAEDLREAMARILTKVKKKGLLPRGWWPTLDTDLEKPGFWRKPKPLRFMKSSPYFQVRFDAGKRLRGGRFPDRDSPASKSGQRFTLEKVKDRLRRAGLAKHYVPYRPYEGYRPGPLREDIVRVLKSVGLEYMFTKAGFNSPPAVRYIDEDFLALNYTSGQWDGWTPFETINDVSDLEKSEGALLKRKKPGWIVSTIDSCLWTFGGEIWRRAPGLHEIALFCANGGASKELINVKPYTVARYARIMAGLDSEKSV